MKLSSNSEMKLSSNSERSPNLLPTQYSTQRGFTLLELLLVLVLIGILIGVGTVSFQAAQVRARDAQRKADLKTIASALEDYYSKNKLTANPYPNSFLGTCAGGGWFCSNSQQDPWIPELTSSFIKRLPKDSINAPGAVCNPTKTADENVSTALTYGYYSVGVAGGKEFILSAKLENPNDPDIGKQIRFNNITYSDHGCFATTSP